MKFKEFYTEARLQQSKDTEGIDKFITQLNDTYSGREQLFNDLRSVIISTGCPSIEFEPLRQALGISKTDKCIISSTVLGRSLTTVLYVILHEIAHQKQYSKYGEDVATEIFLGEISVEEASKKLLAIENTADRWSRKITTALLKKYNLPVPNIPLLYKNYSPAQIKMQVEYFRRLIKSHNIRTIEQANNLIYNLVR